jgi:hypothetical protein
MEQEWLNSLEEQLSGRRVIEKKDSLQHSQQQPQQTRYLESKLSPEDQELANKLQEVESLPRELRGRRLEELLKKRLAGEDFHRLYALCQLGSNEKHPDGYHIVYIGEGEAPVNPEIIPIDAAGDLLGWMFIPCYYHMAGMMSGALASRKPYEILPFKPSKELQQLIEDMIREYGLVTRQDPRQPYITSKEKQRTVTVVIFNDKEQYANAEARTAVVGVLQEVERAIHLYKEREIGREELAVVVRKLTMPTALQTQAEVVKEVLAEETPKLPEEAKVLQEGVYELSYVLSSPERAEDINQLLRIFNQPYELLYEGERVRLRINREVSQKELQQAALRIQQLDVIVGHWRSHTKKRAELMSNIYEVFGQQPQ